jgi:hypothetical protein
MRIVLATMALVLTAMPVFSQVKPIGYFSITNSGCMVYDAPSMKTDSNGVPIALVSSRNVVESPTMLERVIIVRVESSDFFVQTFPAGGSSKQGFVTSSCITPGEPPVAIPASAATSVPQQVPHFVAGDIVNAWAFETGNELYGQCTADEKSLEYYHCMAYISGAADTIGGLQGVGDTTGKTWWKMRAVCPPKLATAGQFKDVVLKYMKANPENRADNAAWIIVRALINAWECPAATK